MYCSGEALECYQQENTMTPSPPLGIFHILAPLALTVIERLGLANIFSKDLDSKYFGFGRVHLGSGAAATASDLPPPSPLPPPCLLLLLMFLLLIFFKN